MLTVSTTFLATLQPRQLISLLSVSVLWSEQNHRKCYSHLGPQKASILAIKGFAAVRTGSPVAHRRIAYGARGSSRYLCRASRAQARLFTCCRWMPTDMLIWRRSRRCVAMGSICCGVVAGINEVGTIAADRRISAIAGQYGVAYLCDATQACGRIPVDVQRDGGITFLILSGHKIHGPKGVGALVSVSRRLLVPLQHGGEHQHGLRAGILNVPGIAGLGLACHLRAMEMAVDKPEIQMRRDRLQGVLVRELSDMVQVNGNQTARLCGNLHVSFLGCPDGAIIARVRDRLAVATGAACSSGIEGPSHVLRAMRLAQPALDGAIRIGVGKWTTDAEIDCTADLMISAARDAKAIIDGVHYARS